MSAFITDEMAEGMARMMEQQRAVDPAFNEECESILETKDYFTQTEKMGCPIRCECCGTWVAMVPETPSPLAYPAWKPGIWEPETWRRHTLRRCNWRRGQRAAQVPADTSAVEAFARETDT